ncbi:hypothetical protein ACIQWR_20055 [Streptomyces sp. NPDC098789]|uniref:hypothetical protein n=1 Tax=Streptomyces sp. NPDC098789 TaxID=3366098 RepID=UPI0038027390
MAIVLRPAPSSPPCRSFPDLRAPGGGADQTVNEQHPHHRDVLGAARDQVLGRLQPADALLAVDAPLTQPLVEARVLGPLDRGLLRAHAVQVGHGATGAGRAHDGQVLRDEGAQVPGQGLAARTRSGEQVGEPLLVRTPEPGLEGERGRPPFGLGRPGSGLPLLLDRPCPVRRRLREPCLDRVGDGRDLPRPGHGVLEVERVAPHGAARCRRGLEQPVRRGDRFGSEPTEIGHRVARVDGGARDARDRFGLQVGEFGVVEDMGASDGGAEVPGAVGPLRHLPLAQGP